MCLHRLQLGFWPNNDPLSNFNDYFKNWNCHLLVRAGFHLARCWKRLLFHFSPSAFYLYRMISHASLYTVELDGYIADSSHCLFSCSNDSNSTSATTVELENFKSFQGRVFFFCWGLQWNIWKKKSNRTRIQPLPECALLWGFPVPSFLSILALCR